MATYLTLMTEDALQRVHWFVDNALQHSGRNLFGQTSGDNFRHACDLLVRPGFAAAAIARQGPALGCSLACLTNTQVYHSTGMQGCQAHFI